MTRTTDDHMIAAALAPARALEPTDAEVARVVAAATATRRHGLGRLTPAALAALVVLAGGTYAVPPLRAAVQDVGSTFAGWLDRDAADGPGRALAPQDHAPNWLRDSGQVSKPRVLAEAGGYKLYVARRRDGSLEFDLGDTRVGRGYPPSSVREELSKHAVVVLGPGAMPHRDKRGHVPLFGLAAPPVASITLAYESGPPLRLNRLKDGFVLLAEPNRSPRTLTALDTNGHELERMPIEYIDWQQYLK